MVTKEELKQAFETIEQFVDENKYLSKHERAELALMKRVCCLLCDKDEEKA